MNPEESDLEDPDSAIHEMAGVIAGFSPEDWKSPEEWRGTLPLQNGF